MDFPGFNTLMHSLQGVNNALSSGDDFELLQFISELSSELAIAQEDFLATIHLPQLIGVLIQCLHKENLPDIPYYSMSCLASLVDSLPHASGIIVSSGGIPVLTSKLLNFEFIDLAENSIKVLEKISIEHAGSILSDGAFENMVQTMDFFENSVQKRILNIAVNVGKSFNSREALDKILTLIPTLVHSLEYRGPESINQNEKCLDFFIVTSENLSRLARPGEESSAYYSQLKELQLMRNIISIISQSPQLIVKSIRLIRYLNKYSSDLCCEFLSMGGSDVIREVLGRPFENPGLVNETLKLVASVLPIKESNSPVENKKLNIYIDRPQYLKAMTEMIFPKAIAMFEELISQDSKAIVIEILEKIIQLYTIQTKSFQGQKPVHQLTDIKPFVSSPYFSSFLSEVLSSKDYKMVENALKIVNVLSDCMIDCVSSNFVREGVVHRVNALKDSNCFKSFKAPKDPLFDFDPALRKCFSSDAEPDSRLIFEEIISKIRNRAMDLNDGPPNLFFQSSFDTKMDSQQNIINLSRGFLDKHKNLDNKLATAYGKELIKIVKLIEGSGDSAIQGFAKLTNSFSVGKRYSSYEICNSKLPEALLKWLTDSKCTTDVHLKRINDFLVVFLKQSQSGESYLEILIGVLIGALQYVQNFTVSVTSMPGFMSRRFNQQIRMQFLYAPDAETEKFLELREKHALFSTCGQFSITAGQYTTFEQLKNAILSAKSTRDISSLRDLVTFSRERRLEMLGEYSEEDEFDDYSVESSLQIKNNEENSKISAVFVVNGVNVELNSTVFTVFSDLKITEGPLIKFKLFIKSENKSASENLRNPCSIYSYVLSEANKVGLDIKSKAQPYLTLLKFFYLVNDQLQVFADSSQFSCLPKLRLPVFKCPKLTSLLSRQIQEQVLFVQSVNPRILQDSIPTVPSLPGWVSALPKTCRFLFPFTVREQYLYSFSIKIPLVKTKARVSRLCLLQSAISVMSDSHLLKQGHLEIDYEGEVGIGTGPSLEFFSLVSNEIRNLSIWRNSEDSGLFPLPLQACCSTWKEKFNFIGRFVGKALADKRQIDLPFNPIFWKLVLNKPVTVYDLAKVDKSLGQIIIDFQELVKQYKAKKTKILYKEVPVESLGLNFILPGFEKIELKPGGMNCKVTLDNLEEYVNLVSNCILLQNAQAAAFRQGLEVLMPANVLELFSGDEMEDLLCGQIGTQWKMEELQQHINPAHGYSGNSTVFNNLLIVMSEFNLQEQRKFLQFITGSPRLPVGGFAALSPKLTVVRKDPSLPGMHPDEYLPSVMTCQNYLKIPEYSSFEILQRNLKYAVQEGHESFHLS